MRLTIKLNGTEETPSLDMGFNKNPFPQVPKYGSILRNELLANLEANPIKDVDDLRNRLEGCSEEFIEGCCKRLEKGKIITFDITFPDK